MSRHVIHVTVDIDEEDPTVLADALAQIRGIIEEQLANHVTRYPIWEGYSGPPVTEYWTA